MKCRAVFVGSLIRLFSGLNLVYSEECCHTDYDTYELCSVDCCSRTFGTYGYCCSYSSYSSYKVETSKCEGWWASHIWAAVLIGVGSLGGLAFSVSLLCCIVKACTAGSRKTGPQGAYPGQSGQGVTMVSGTQSHQVPQQHFLQQLPPPQQQFQQQQLPPQQFLQQQLPPPPPQHFPYGVTTQQPQTVYSPGSAGTSSIAEAPVNQGDTQKEPKSGTTTIAEE